jgi:hypothetical protein
MHPEIKARPSEVTIRDFLNLRVPSYKDNLEEDRVHICISIASMVLTEFVNDKYVFGMPSKEPVRSAWKAWQSLAGESLVVSC